MGVGSVPALRPPPHTCHCRGGGEGGACEGRRVCGMGRQGDRVRRRRPQEDQERDDEPPLPRLLPGMGLRQSEGEFATQDRRGTAAGGRHLRARALDQSDRDHQLQDHLRDADAQRHRALAASGGARVWCRCGAHAGGCGRGGGRPRWRHPGDRAAEHSTHRGVHAVRQDRRDPGDRRHGDGALGLLLVQSGDRCRPGQRAGARRCDRRSQGRRAAHHRQ